MSDIVDDCMGIGKNSLLLQSTYYFPVVTLFSEAILTLVN